MAFARDTATGALSVAQVFFRVWRAGFILDPNSKPRSFNFLLPVE